MKYAYKETEFTYHSRKWRKLFQCLSFEECGFHYRNHSESHLAYYLKVTKQVHLQLSLRMETFTEAFPNAESLSSCGFSL